MIPHCLTTSRKGLAHLMSPAATRLLTATFLITANLMAEGVVTGIQHNDGRLLLGELNCTGCHAANEETQKFLIPREAPLLDDVGARITPQYLRAWLDDPQRVKPGTPMPDLLHGLASKKKAETVEALLHFLVSLGGPMKQTGAGASGFQIQNGKMLYHKVGCVACHDPAGPPSIVWDSESADGEGERNIPKLAHPSVPLGELSSKTRVDILAKFLMNPHKTRPAGRMPGMKLSRSEANSIAAFLLRDQASKDEKGWGEGLDVAVFEGSWRKLPDFDKLQPKVTKTAKRIDLSYRTRTHQYGLRFRGMIHIPQDGKYTFYTTSDDGSRLWIGGKVVVENDGVHGPLEKKGEIELTKGRHSFQVAYFELGGRYKFEVKWELTGKGGFKKQPIPSSAMLHSSPAMIPRGMIEFTIDKEKVAAGGKRFDELGCASCHKVNVAGETISSPLKAPAISALNPKGEAGCLDEQKSNGRPRYALSLPQRESIAKALVELQNGPQPLDDQARLSHTMRVFNCFACHSRGDEGGPGEGRAKYFSTTGHLDMGDEGRLPPHLNEIGAKLSPVGFDEILFKGVTVRPHMATRMPQFDEGAIGHLPQVLSIADARKVPETSHTELTGRLVNDGRYILGTNGFGCINCHSLGIHKSLGMPSVNLLNVPKRVQLGWFRTYLADPAALRPGTRMPKFWIDGKSPLEKIQEGDMKKQIDAIWAYLSVGTKAGLPGGMSRGGSASRVEPENEPIVFRTFLNSVGAHAITVGFPQRTHVAFDARRVRMALAWPGDFIDAGPSWSGRGGRYSSISSKDTVRFPEGPPFAVLQNDLDKWPADPGRPSGVGITRPPSGWKFKGYRFDKNRQPTFMYRFGEINIEETPAADFSPKGTYLKRRFVLKSPAKIEKLWYRAAVGGEIKSEKDGSFVADGRFDYRFKNHPNTRPSVRTVNDMQELTVPILFKAEDSGDSFTSSMEVELIW